MLLVEFVYIFLIEYTAQEGKIIMEMSSKA